MADRKITPPDRFAGQQHADRSMTGNMRQDAERYEGRIGVGEGTIALTQMRGRGWVAQRGNVGRSGEARANGDLRSEAPPSRKRKDDRVR